MSAIASGEQSGREVVRKLVDCSDGKSLEHICLVSTRLMSLLIKFKLIYYQK